MDEEAKKEEDDEEWERKTREKKERDEEETRRRREKRNKKKGKKGGKSGEVEVDGQKSEKTGVKGNIKPVDVPRRGSAEEHGAATGLESVAEVVKENGIVIHDED